MHMLHDAGLRGAHLFPVNTPLMVGRYNDCLVSLGLEPTKLTEFSIDKIGWSPEIAEEKEDNIYLAHGEANLLGIILSVAQADAALHHPLRSFDRYLVNRVFSEEGKTLRDITTLTGVCLDFEDGISHFNDPADLLMINSFLVRFSTPKGWTEAARWQRKAVIDFESSDEAWADESLRKKIIGHAKEFGDLRRRNLILHEIAFKDVECYFSQAFGGIFVLRNENEGGKEEILISLTPQEKVDGVSMYRLEEKRLLKVLENSGFLHHSSERDLHRMRELVQQKEDVEVIVLSTEYPEMDFVNSTLAQRKGLVHKHKKLFPAEYFELERYLLKLGSGTFPEISKQLRARLLLPVACESPVRTETLMMLLSYLDQTDLVRLYRFNKKEFYRQYDTWPDSLKRWAIHRIMRDYKGI